jgi:fluoride ion exporter CrcB/FEX
MKKTIPLYIGLATGFCGSFTSFSSFIRDVFLQLTNQPLAIPLNSASASVVPRHGGDSFMTVLAVVILNLWLCLSALKAGAHLAIGLEKFTPPLPAFIISKAFDGYVVVFSWGLWFGSIFLAIWPPNQTWRGRVLFAIVFAPLGCIVRFYVSLRLNGIAASFPLGTFVVNLWERLYWACVGICNVYRSPLLEEQALEAAYWDVKPCRAFRMDSVAA